MGWQDRPYNYRSERTRSGFALPPLTPLSIGVMGACLAVFVAQSFTGPVAELSPIVRLGGLSFDNALAMTQPWRWITYQYVHLSGTHIVFNMLGVYFFLPQLERLWGWKKALGFYTLGGIVAGMAFGVMHVLFGYHLIAGASGSVLAAIGACAYLFPAQQVIFFLFAVPIRILAVLLAVIYVLSMLGERDASDAAHLGGLAFGYFAPMLLSPMIGRLSRQLQARRLRRLTAEEQDEQEVVDRILQKVHDQGMHSLTWRERRILRRATQRQRERDLELPRQRFGH